MGPERSGEDGSEESNPATYKPPPPVAPLTMEVECNLFGPLREAVGQKSVTRSLEEGATVGDLLAGLADEYPALSGQLLDGGEVADGLNVTLNGTDVGHLDGAATALSEGDVVRAAPPVVGG